MKLLFIFLDGVGLGKADPAINPFARPSLPFLEQLLAGHKLILDGSAPAPFSDFHLLQADQASLLSLDACLGIDGLPQSATGQASLFTGQNFPRLLGHHDGPKPTPLVVSLLQKGTLLISLQQHGKTASLANAFPPRYFEAIASSYRIPGVISLIVQQAGIPLKTRQDLFSGEALSVDFTAEGWRSNLGIEDTPLLTHRQAGERLGSLATHTDLTIFEYWLTDVAGHHQDMSAACQLLDKFDQVLASLVNSWDFDQGLILLTSDHGNLEDLSTRHHTRNVVPLVLIGSPSLRATFIAAVENGLASGQKPDLTSITPAILHFLG